MRTPQELLDEADFAEARLMTEDELGGKYDEDTWFLLGDKWYHDERLIGWDLSRFTQVRAMAKARIDREIGEKIKEEG